ncbi:DUF2255 family protein [Virgibacillus salexigens]|uniref:Uncharacterized protein n=2 Tax=Virgibacillus TaxID=84406 RepID=A0A024QDD4_9BACI|nr:MULTISPECIES: DUF2255 family protein [Virgibacillus]GGJ45395.1 hypothetical protein GCM10007111_04280 [Virgibacillus kapii]CDQ39951.1 hypothetical protein BN990_02269 [Virgibacillus massiliensis]
MVIKEVSYSVYYIPIETGAELTEKINQAYREKYGESPYVPPMMTQ